MKATEVGLLIEMQVEWAELVGVKLPEQGLWLYSLLSRIDKPLYPDCIRLIFFALANYTYSVLTQDNMKQPDVAFCFMSGATQFDNPMFVFITWFLHQVLSYSC
jgi:hypothetical protein